MTLFDQYCGHLKNYPIFDFDFDFEDPATKEVLRQIFECSRTLELEEEYFRSCLKEDPVLFECSLALDEGRLHESITSMQTI